MRGIAALRNLAKFLPGKAGATPLDSAYYAVATPLSYPSYRPNGRCTFGTKASASDTTEHHHAGISDMSESALCLNPLGAVLVHTQCPDTLAQEVRWMKKPGNQQLLLAVSCVACLVVALRNINGLE